MDRAWTAPPWGLAQDAETATGPPPEPLRAPVFIQDAVTPWGPDTLLLALWRAQQDRGKGGDQDS
ncbi:hypothetical protein FGK63_11980 [Ruegeria sediminis]|uniref:Uncharacterized protein n=1 Tax=Ruegeria sediminis TaxID=2583820 RepID=A0ABY2WVQ7_9RHOB|nr:hypothetical protein [Ruegeria sediminis]TMV06835.1 hypothetical protein FGK63_11980 [Ruegeria sediminis]